MTALRTLVAHQAQASHGPAAPTALPLPSVGMTLVPGAAASLRGHGGTTS